MQLVFQEIVVHLNSNACFSKIVGLGLLDLVFSGSCFHARAGRWERIPQRTLDWCSLPPMMHRFFSQRGSLHMFTCLFVCFCLLWCVRCKLLNSGWGWDLRDWPIEGCELSSIESKGSNRIESSHIAPNQSKPEAYGWTISHTHFVWVGWSVPFASGRCCMEWLESKRMSRFNKSIQRLAVGERSYLGGLSWIGLDWIGLNGMWMDSNVDRSMIDEVWFLLPLRGELFGLCFSSDLFLPPKVPKGWFWAFFCFEKFEFFFWRAECLNRINLRSRHVQWCQFIQNV